MIVKKDDIISNQSNNKYYSETIYSKGRVDTKIYLKTEGDGNILIGDDRYFSEPDNERTILGIKLAIKFYENKVENYPTLNEWNGIID